MWIYSVPENRLIRYRLHYARWLLLCFCYIREYLSGCSRHLSSSLNTWISNGLRSLILRSWTKRVHLRHVCKVGTDHGKKFRWKLCKAILCQQCHMKEMCWKTVQICKKWLNIKYKFYFEKQKQQVLIQIRKFIGLKTVYPPTCFGHILWPPWRRCFLKGILHRTSKQFTIKHVKF
jgi:hypothetical protein